MQFISKNITGFFLCRVKSAKSPLRRIEFKGFLNYPNPYSHNKFGAFLFNFLSQVKLSIEL